MASSNSKITYVLELNTSGAESGIRKITSEAEALKGKFDTTASSYSKLIALNNNLEKGLKQAEIEATKLNKTLDTSTSNKKKQQLQEELDGYKKLWDAQGKANYEAIKLAGQHQKYQQQRTKEIFAEIDATKKLSQAQKELLQAQWKATSKPSSSAAGIREMESRAAATIAAERKRLEELSRSIKFPFEKAPSSLTNNDFLSVKELTALKKEQAAIEKKATAIAAIKEKEGLQWAKEWATQLQQNIATKNKETAAEKALIKELDLEIAKRQQLAKESRLLELKNQYALLPKQRPLSTLKQAEQAVAYIKTPEFAKQQLAEEQARLTKMAALQKDYQNTITKLALQQQQQTAQAQAAQNTALANSVNQLKANLAAKIKAYDDYVASIRAAQKKAQQMLQQGIDATNKGATQAANTLLASQPKKLATAGVLPNTSVSSIVGNQTGVIAGLTAQAAAIQAQINQLQNAKQVLFATLQAIPSGVLSPATLQTIANNVATVNNTITQLNSSLQQTNATAATLPNLVTIFNNIQTATKASWSSFLNLLSAVRQYRQGIADLQKATLDAANEIKKEIADRNALRKSYADIHPELAKAAALRVQEKQLIFDTKAEYKKYQDVLNNEKDVNLLQLKTAAWQAYLAAQRAAYNSNIALQHQHIKNFEKEIALVERLQQSALRGSSVKQTAWSHSGTLQQMQFSGASAGDIKTQKLKFDLEDIEKKHANLVNKFKNNVLAPNIDAAKIKQLKDAFNYDEAKLAKQRASIQQLIGDQERLNNLKQQEVHHHDSLIVRALKLVSIYSLLNAVRQDMLAGLRSIPNTGIELESTQAVFKAIFVTQKDITEQFTFLDNLADRTGARLLTLQESFRDFAASAKFSGESIGNIHQIFNDITEAGTVLHLPADKMKSAFVAINQMYAKGQVMMEELKKQLGNQLPAAVAVFARSLDLSTAQLMDKMKKGLIRPEESIAGFAAMYKQIFATRDAFEIASQGMNASIGRLDTEWTRVAQGIYKATSSYMIAGLKSATSALTWFKDNLGLVATVAGVAAVAIGVHLVQAFTAFAVRAAIARTELNLLTISYMSMDAAARASAIATASTPLTALASQLAIIGKIALRWAGWVGVIVGVGAAIYKVGQATINVNGESVKLGDVLVAMWDSAIAKAKEYTTVLTAKDGVIGTTLEFMDRLAGGIVGGVTLNKNQWDYSGILTGWEKGFMEVSRNALTDAMESAATSVAGTDAAKKVAKDTKAMADAAAYQAKLDEESANRRKVLFEDFGAGAASELNASMVAKNLELETKISQSAITRIGHTVQLELKTLDIQKTALDKKFERQELTIIDYYQQQIDLLERKYAIERRGDEAKLAILEAEATKAAAYEESLYNTDKTIQAITDKESKIAGIENALAETAKNPKKALIAQYDTSAQEIAARDKVSIEIEKNRTEAYAAIIKADREAFYEANKTYLGFKPKENPFASTPLTFNRPKYNEEVASLEKEKKAYAESQKAKVRSSSMLQERFAFTKNVETEISSRIADSLGSLAMKNSSKYDALIAKEAAANKIDPNFVKAIIARESSFNPDAMSTFKPKKGAYEGQTQHAYGLMQLYRPEREGFKGGSIEQNIAEGTKQLAGELKYFGDTKLAAAAYNAGRGAVEKYNGVPPYKETQNYVNAVESTYAQLGGSPFSSAKGSSPLNKAITASTIKTDKTEEVRYAIQEKQVQAVEEFNKLLAAQADLYKNYVNDLEKGTLEFIKQEGTLTDIQAKDLIDLDTLKKKEKLEKELGAANDILAGKKKYISQIELDSAKRAIEIIPLAQKQLEIEKDRAFFAEKRAKLELQITNAETASSNAEALRQAKYAGTPEAQIGQYGFSSQWMNAYQTQTKARTAIEQGVIGQNDNVINLLGKKKEQLTNEFNYNNMQGGFSPEKLDEYLNKMSDIELKIQNTKNATEGLKTASNQLWGEFANESFKMIGDEFLNWTNGAKSAGRAFKDLAIGFARMIQDMLIQALQAAAIKAVLRMFGLSSGGSVDQDGNGISGMLGFKSGGYLPAYASGGNVLSFPAGGMVRGKGTNTNDSNLASVAKGSFILNAKATAKAKKNQLVALSNNELVISPEQVANIGLSTLKDINTEKYSSGGLVGGSNTSGSSNRASNKANNVYNINVSVPNGTSNPQQFGKDVSAEIVKAIAKEEARKQIALDNKKRANGR